jgi:arachidonate 15-lipoxygenase
MSSFLPFQFISESLRQFALKQKRLTYKYNFEYIDQLAMLDGLPVEEYPSLWWLFLVTEKALKLSENISKFNESNPLQTNDNLDDFSEFDDILPDDLKDVLKSLSVADVKATGDDWAEYDSVFTTLDRPAISKNQKFLDDTEFVWMRLAGSNPLVIKGVSGLEDKFPVTEQHYQSVIPNDSLAAAAQEGRLFITDYIILENFETGETDGKQKYVYSPIVLFALSPSHEDSLAVIAIQCGQDPAKNPIIVPPQDGASDSDAWAWQIAKIIVQIADANYHELISHLGLTHLFIEPFAIATERQLSVKHPLGILLRQHFQGTLFINFAASKILVGRNQPLDNLQAGSYKTSSAFSAQAVRNFNFNENILPDTFINRNVNSLKNYPYREDAMMIWDAIHQWVSNYLSTYYQNDDEVKADGELQAWVTEIISPDGGRINGFGENNGIESRSYLIRAVTQIIFTASAQHAAVNFSQPDWMSYTPVMPMAGYAPVPTDFSNVSSKDFFDFLPSVKRAASQLELSYLLGSVYFTNLGNYSNLNDGRIQPFLQDFQKQLEKIENTIKDKNMTRHKAYEYLLPSKIPQSINI